MNLKKNSIIIIKGKVSKKYNNISASSVNIVAFKKQTVDTENIDINNQIQNTQPDFSISAPVEDIQFGNIFS